MPAFPFQRNFLPSFVKCVCAFIYTKQIKVVYVQEVK